MKRLQLCTVGITLVATGAFGLSAAAEARITQPLTLVALSDSIPYGREEA
jgi:hypothetical protein